MSPACGPPPRGSNYLRRQGSTSLGTRPAAERRHLLPQGRRLGGDRAGSAQRPRAEPRPPRATGGTGRRTSAKPVIGPERAGLARVLLALIPGRIAPASRRAQVLQILSAAGLVVAFATRSFVARFAASQYSPWRTANVRSSPVVVTSSPEKRDRQADAGPENSTERMSRSAPAIRRSNSWRTIPNAKPSSSSEPRARRTSQPAPAADRSAGFGLRECRPRAPYHVRSAPTTRSRRSWRTRGGPPYLRLPSLRELRGEPSLGTLQHLVPEGHHRLQLLREARSLAAEARTVAGSPMSGRLSTIYSSSRPTDRSLERARRGSWPVGPNRAMFSCSIVHS
jgi:hypothetical protein